MPLISVVMSAYNGSDQLPKTIDSILLQSLGDFELIIINDGSQDATARILDDYAQQDARIKVFHQENQGLTKSLIDGCNYAQGTYLARMDAGDISYPERFKIQASLLDSNLQLGMVYCGADFYGPSGELLYNVSRSSDPVVAHQQVLHQKLGPPGHPSVMIRKSIYYKSGGYRPEFYFSQDSDLWLRIAEISQVCSTSETLLGIYLDLHGISASKKVIQYQFAKLAHKAKDLRLKGLSDHPILNEAMQLQEQMKSAVTHRRNKSIDYATHVYFLGSLCSGKYPQLARKYFWMAFRNYPLNPKYIIRYLLSYLS